MIQDLYSIFFLALGSDPIFFFGTKNVNMPDLYSTFFFLALGSDPGTKKKKLTCRICTLIFFGPSGPAQYLSFP